MQTPEIIARFTQIEPINMKPGEVVFDRIVEDGNVFYLSIKCTCGNVRSYCYSENGGEYLQKARSLGDLANILYYDEHIVMSKSKSIKIPKKDLPKTFICLNDRANYDWMSHGEANGYVAINRRYSIFGKDYDELYNDIDVHGGLTFGESLAECKEHFPHVFKTYLELEGTSEDDDVFIYGFDTMHSGDNEVNWSKENVEKETKYLQEQMLSFYIVNDNDNETKNTSR